MLSGGPARGERRWRRRHPANPVPLPLLPLLAAAAQPLLPPRRCGSPAAACAWGCPCSCEGVGQQTAPQGWRAAGSKLGHGAPQHAATARQAGTVRRISCFPAAQARTRRPQHLTREAPRPRSHHIEAAAALDDAARLTQLLDGGLDLHGCSGRDTWRQGLSGSGGGRRRRRLVRAPKLPGLL